MLRTRFARGLARWAPFALIPMLGSSPARGAVAPLPEHRLTLDQGLPLLRSFSQPAVETPFASWRFAWGPWGMSQWDQSMGGELRLSSNPVFAQREPSASQGPSWGLMPSFRDSHWLGSTPQVTGTPSLSLLPQHDGFPDGWEAPLAHTEDCEIVPVRFTRYGSETDSFPLLDCDGAIAPDALDRLSIMARPPGVPHPGMPLPNEPAPGVASGEWLPSIRLLHPRLLWLVAQIASVYPHHGIYIVSGYRTGEEGVHGQARALDMQVIGVSNERLYRACRRYRDVGCGYYPNHDFVHVDVRPAGTGARYWIDVSTPGMPSKYVTSWPGLEDGRSARFDAGTE